MKIIVTVLDGAADEQIESIGGTPLEVAFTPNLDKIAARGACGMMRVLPIAPESDEAVLALLGYDPLRYYTGRGPLEALGAGIDFEEGHVVFRCNFACLEGDKIVSVRIPDLKPEEAKELEKAINRHVSLGVPFEFKVTTGYRGVLVLKDKSLSPRVTNVHPGYILQFVDLVMEKGKTLKSIPMSIAKHEKEYYLQECKPLEDSEAARRTASLVNNFVKQSFMVLEKHPVNERRKGSGKLPANVILTRDPGNRKPSLFNFQQTYKMRAAAIVDMPVEKGIARAAGIDVIEVPYTGDVKQDSWSKAMALLKYYDVYDFFYIHLKGPDTFAHLGDAKGKKEAIETIDRYFYTPVLERVDLSSDTLVVTCDHATSSKTQAHTDAPVPIAVAGPKIKADEVNTFDEIHCAHGRLGVFPAKFLVPFLTTLR